MFRIIAIILLLSFQGLANGQPACNIGELTGKYEGEAKNILIQDDGQPWETPCQLTVQIVSSTTGIISIPKCRCAANFGTAWNCYVGPMKIHGNEVTIFNTKTNIDDVVGQCVGSSITVNLNNTGQYSETVTFLGSLSIKNSDREPIARFSSSNFALPNDEYLEGTISKSANK